MLNILNKNIVFLLVFYIVLLLMEVFHFGSDVYVIIMSESLLCFSILLYILSFVFQEMFVSGIYIITLKYNYIYIFFKNVVNLNINVYTIFLNTFNFFILFFFKNFKSLQKFKNKLKLIYLNYLTPKKRNVNKSLNLKNIKIKGRRVLS